MPYLVLTKPRSASGMPANMPDYATFRRDFTWEAARALLDGLPGGGLNIAHEAVDRHASGPRAGRLALRWLGKEGQFEDYTYLDLARQ